MKAKTICLVAPSLQGGGIERSMVTLAEHFQKRGHIVYYVACRAGKHFFELPEAIHFEEPLYKHSTSGYKKVLTYLRMVNYLRTVYKNIHPDVILSFGDSINPWAILANSKSNYHIFISDRISPKQRLSWDKNLMKKITYRKATGIIAQSTFAADYKKQVFGSDINIRIIPNALRVIEQTEIVEKQKYVIGVGRLSIEKGFDRLIDAFARIGGHDDWRLIIVGDGPVKSELMQQATSLGISERVEFLGLRKDVDALLAESSIFVIPSRCEGFPNALCEAMASPLPCIAFDSIAADLIENEKNGILLEDGDIDALSDSMARLMDDPHYREELAHNAFDIRSRLDKETVGDMFLDFILQNQ